MKLFRWFRNISIAKKLYFTVGIMALLIGIELFALYFSINTLSSVRAYVGGEGLWSKAQKDAMYYLYKYGITHDENDYNAFRNQLKTPLGDSKARLELLKENPDLEIARQGFIEGRNHPNDIDGMIKLFRRFNRIYYINKAIQLWTEGEPILFNEIVPIAEKIHAEITSGNPSDEKIKALLIQIDPINKRLTKIEDDFSFTLGEGSRWLEGLVLKLLFLIALTVEVTGLFLAISVSRSIQKGLGEIITAADNFAKGEKGIRAKVFSTDEIGVVANAFNTMSQELENNITVLENTRKKFEQLLEFAPDAIIITNKKGVINLINLEAEKLFEYYKNDVNDVHVSKIIPYLDQKFFDTPQTKKLNINVRVSGIKKNNKSFPSEITVNTLETDEGQLIAIAIRDISDRWHIKDLENKNKELEQFAYITSHDLLEPLNTITSFSGLLQIECKNNLNTDASNYVKYIQDSAQRMSSLITDLLHYSRIGRNSAIELVDCNILITNVLDDLKGAISGCNAQFKVEQLPTIRCYPTEFRLLFQNLLSNAIKFRKSDITPYIHISAILTKGYWKFSVKDNGIGIDPKNHEKIFIIFRQLNKPSEYSGSGIGLAHCKKIVEMHNGKIWVESDKNKGSCFYFTIPEIL
jgi:PAS domain S-box-containing protein